MLAQRTRVLETFGGPDSVDLRSRLSKIRAMSGAEAAWRVHAQVFAVKERMFGRQGLASQPERLVRVLQPSYLRQDNWKKTLLDERRRRKPRFVRSLDDPPGMRQLLLHEYAEECRRTWAAAEGASRHTFHFFGRAFQFGQQIDWHADPVTGRRWPQHWHRDIVLTGQRAAGDVKYVWELNRHQFLIDLAKRYWVWGHAADAAAVLAIVRDWIQKNPFGRGVNWASPLEPAYRSLSWLWTYDLCLDAPELDEHTHTIWLAAFHDHARFIYSHLEMYSSPFNHLIGEAAVLYLIGVLFPEFRDARAWRARGRRVLETRLSDQFYSDGGSAEQAVFYHHATLGFYLLAALIGRANGDEFPPAVWMAIERAVEFSMYLVQPDGRMPAIGDTDDAKPIRLEHRPLWDFRAFQAVGAVLFNRPDFKYVAGRFPEDAVWLLGRRDRDRFLSLDRTPPKATSRAFRESGYCVLRSDWSDRADSLCFDCGEQARGLRRDGAPSAAHGHADCLSVTVSLGGRAALVDAGFYTYNGDAPWESHFRGTAAHNTARIDGRDQARYLGKMTWSEVPQARLEHWMADGHQAAAVASHDGYARGVFGTIHRRTIWLRPGGYVLIYDEFLGNGEHQVELNFQLPPGSPAQLTASGVLTGDAIGISWVGSKPISATLREGGVHPHEGWVAPSLGVKTPAPRLTLDSRLTGRHEAFLTVVADLAPHRVAAITATTDDLPVGVLCDLTVTTGDFVDHIIATTGVPVGAGPFQTDASLAVWRLHNGRVVGTTRIGGSYIRVGEKTSAVLSTSGLSV